MTTPNWDTMNQAFKEATSTFEYLDRFAGRMAEMLVGRMRKVGSAYVLRKLKAELARFDSRTGKWRD